MSKEIAAPTPEDPSAMSKMIALKFNDKKEVMLISSAHSAAAIDTDKEDKKTGVAMVKPDAVLEYNQYMKGVDQFDQNLKYYAFTRKTWKWWKRAAFHLIHLAKVQAFLVFKMMNPASKQTQLQFTLELVESLTKDSEPPAAFQRRQANPPKRMKEKHYITKVPVKGKTSFPSRVCVVCSTRRLDGSGYAKKKVTRYQCATCDKGLCLENCFKIFHEKKNFRVDA